MEDRLHTRKKKKRVHQWKLVCPLFAHKETLLRLKRISKSL